MPSSLKSLAWCCAFTALIGFFLPWAQLDIGNSKVGKEAASSIRKSLGKTFKAGGSKEPSWMQHRSKNSPAIPTRITGVMIPQLANRQHVKTLTQLAKLFTKSDEQLGLKSYAVYLLPGLIVLLAVLLTRCGDHALIRWGVAGCAAAVAGFGFWKLLTIDTRAQFAIAIGPGLWMSLWAYAGMSAAAVLASQKRV